MANPKVPQELWTSYIVEKLWKTNPHLILSSDESKFVQGGSVVYIPQAGSKPTVVKNRNTYPATAVQRNDTAVMYALDVWTTDPTHIPMADQLEISYEKTDSVLGDHVNGLAEAIGDEILYRWVYGSKPAAGGTVTNEALPVARQIPTSGESISVNGDDGQTGTRKATTYKEFQKAQAKMNKDGVPKNDRYAMLESNMHQEFVDSLSSNQMAAFQASADLSKGIVGEFAGFKILERSSVLAFTAAGAPIVPGQALSATDNLAGLCWQKDCVTRASGDTKLFQDMDNPLYYGDVYSGLLKMGGRCKRSDWKGVIAIVQAATA